MLDDMADERFPPGEGYYYEDDPDKVQEAQPHSLKPLRTGRGDGVDYPDPGNIVDAHIGDAPPPRPRSSSVSRQVLSRNSSR